MFKRILPLKLSGHEKLKHAGTLDVSVLQFWQYAFSNLNSNVLRGAYAEFLVENALRPVDEIAMRNPWGDFDVLAPAARQ